MDGPEEDAALSVDVGLVLVAEGCLEEEGGAYGDTPTEGEVSGLAGLGEGRGAKQRVRVKGASDRGRAMRVQESGGGGESVVVPHDSFLAAV